MPTLEDDGWELESAEQRNRENPDSFEIPSLEERSSLRAGTVVQLLFLFMNEEDGEEIIDCERLWVAITDVRDGRYIGRLQDAPVTSAAIAAGQTVEFLPEHIATVMIPRTDPRHPRYQAPPDQAGYSLESKQPAAASPPAPPSRRWWQFWK